MPQHPRYSNNASRNLERLFTLLEQLESFGIIHEHLYQNLDLIMAELYPSASKKYAAYYGDYQAGTLEISDGGKIEEKSDEELLQELDNIVKELNFKFDELKGGNNIGDLNEDDEDFNLSVSQLFEFIDSDEKEQFIQDFRNTIDYYIHSGTWSTDGVTDRILRARDIEYYKKHIYLEEDTEAKSKYEYRNKTVWFPRGINPVRTGIYEVSELEYQNAKHDGYAYWNGKTWFVKKILLKDCVEQKRTKENKKFYGGYCWRGFLEQPKD